MKDNSSRTAILLFARSSATEAREKWLPKGEKIYPLLNERSRKLASESGLAFFHSSERDQVGKDFGTRFAHAIKQIFDQGYASIICVGNDTPQLMQKDIQAALEQLHSNNAVIGPSRDGGIYLLGMHATDFDCDMFVGLKWCTSLVQDGLINYFRSKGRVLQLLGSYQDLDKIADLPILLKTSGIIPIGILKIFRIAIEQFHLWFFNPELHRIPTLWEPNLNRGSPRSIGRYQFHF